MAAAPDTTSIPGYTIFREGDYDSVAAHAMTPQGTVHPLGKLSWGQKKKEKERVKKKSERTFKKIERES